MLVMKVAGSRAAAHANGPGSFQPAFLDAVYRLEPRDLRDEGDVR
jgi:hydroxyethylthiazole kinase